MQKNGKVKDPVKIPWFPDDWRDQIEAYLASQLKDGGTLYGFRSDGRYVAKTKDGDRVIVDPDLKSD